jgi:DNA-binding response OmpR family regulator
MRILIIEDNPEIANYLKSALHEECFEVDTTHDGYEGLQMARINEYDLILLDLFLPGMSGEEICRQIRFEKNPIPILVLTVETHIQQKTKLLNVGADDYLTKPFSFEELLARIKSLLRRPKKLKTDRMIVDDLIIDVGRNRVSRAGKEIKLTHKEYSLLEYLARHQGMVLTRGKILENVWDMNADVFSNSIEVHIFNLRYKLDRGYSRKLIHTVPNRGYMLEVR